MKTCQNLILHVLFPISLGAFIYILFRKESLTVFIWIENLSLLDEVMILRDITSGLKERIPQIILYSLPDGIWVYSGTYLMILIWKDNIKFFSAWSWILLPFICSVTAEILQSMHIVEGQYCPYDIMFYISFLLLALFNIKLRREYAI